MEVRQDTVLAMLNSKNIQDVQMAVLALNTMNVFLDFNDEQVDELMRRLFKYCENNYRYRKLIPRKGNIYKDSRYYKKTPRKVVQETVRRIANDIYQNL